MVCNQDYSFRKAALKSTIRKLAKLAAYALIAANSDDSRAPPLCHTCDSNAKGLLCKRYILVVPFLINPV